MLRGRKRFRVAGCTLGSEVVIDCMLEPGDAIFIPALTFHSGGDSTMPSEDSIMLSVALAWENPDAHSAASAVVNDWRIARQALLANNECANTWEWAGSPSGAKTLRIFGESAASAGRLLQQFL